MPTIDDNTISVEDAYLVTAYEFVDLVYEDKGARAGRLFVRSIEPINDNLFNVSGNSKSVTLDRHDQLEFYDDEASMEGAFQLCKRIATLRRDLDAANARAAQAERERDALIAQLDRMGLSNLVKDEQVQRSKRVFVYGAAFHLDGVSGQYGWITREDQSRPNPYHIITDGSKAGLWYKSDDFKRVIDAASAP